MREPREMPADQNPRSSRYADKIRLFDLDFDALTQQQLIERIAGAVRENRRCWIATVNVNFVCLAARSPSFGAILRSADVITADGMPIVWVSRLGERPLPERVTGADLLKPLAVRAEKESWRIFLCGGEPGVAERAAATLRSFAPGLQVVGTAAPAFPTAASASETEPNRELLEDIAKSQPDILLVALGSPKQEQWIYHHLETDQLDVPVVVGIGAAFDFLAGRQSRAPQWMRNMGLEWTHRMTSQPFRLGPRYARDGLTFARLVLKQLRRSRRVAPKRHARSKSPRPTDPRT